MAFVLAGGTGENEAEESFPDAGEVVVVLHAVCGQGGRVNDDTEAVLNIEGVHARAVEGDGEDVPLNGGFGSVREAAGVDGIFMQPDSANDIICLCGIPECCQKLRICLNFIQK